MSSKDRSPKSFKRGLWSSAMTRSLQPSTKWRALSRASATASASPSMGAYLDSVGWVKRDPTRVTFHPSWQQKISRDGHWQCFWNNQYPIPSLLQSVARQVSQFLSKILTPSWILVQISFLEALNACCRSVLHVNGEDGLSRERKGDITDAMEKAYATWLTRPSQARMSVMPVGVGNSEMARRYFRQGLTSVLVISNPANSTSSWEKWNLLGLRVMSFLAKCLTIPLPGGMHPQWSPTRGWHRRCIWFSSRFRQRGCHSGLCKHLQRLCSPVVRSDTDTAPMGL